MSLAIAQLRLCHYQDVQKEIELFQNDMRTYNKIVSRIKNAVVKSNQQKLMSEAILKMKFLFVWTFQSTAIGSDVKKIDLGQRSPVRISAVDPMKKVLNQYQMDFRVDDLWPMNFFIKFPLKIPVVPALKGRDPYKITLGLITCSL